MANMQELLSPIKTALNLDGYEMVLLDASEKGISIEVRAGADACADCLAPATIFKGVIVDTLAQAGYHVPFDDVRIVYPVTS